MSWIRGPIIAVLACLVALTGCSGGSDPEPGNGAGLPSGEQTLQQSAAAMRALRSIAFTIATEGQPNIAVRGGDVKLLRSGDAQGSLQIQQAGLTVETDFVLVGDTVYYKGLTGAGYQKAPRSQIVALYDPSAVLDPERGLAKLLTVARSPKTEAREKVGGKDAYKVRATVPRETAAALIPGLTTDLTGHVWVSAADHRLLKMRGVVPPAGGGQEGAVVLTFTEFDSAYTFKPPV
ncbi:LppX_LprAFG lipoprotein [Thermomonospora cellulosilytica]|uniref:Lipoprotein LprG n=1 Tax=Thermomonospora cellulosilytica TaxID=1411118 RepID=A0A7W3N3D8_9ACTN|nr:LppX_LprAFG lipoprotein [Thermomonospora cellulosilytica]MBA9006804.1 lipoprotein LprG [Thermomonospora cellulosilytica]